MIIDHLLLDDVGKDGTSSMLKGGDQNTVTVVKDLR